LGLRHLLAQFAPFWKGKFARIAVDNASLWAMMLGETTKSDQVLPVLLDCVTIIVAYDIKPHFDLIGTDDMIFADPLSRWDHPTQASKYKKQFRQRKRKYLHLSQPWLLPPVEPPADENIFEHRRNWSHFVSPTHSLRSTHVNTVPPAPRQAPPPPVQS
jgi:hypothetical protein